MAEVPASDAPGPLTAPVSGGGRSKKIGLYKATNGRTGFDQSLSAQLEVLAEELKEKVLRSAAFAGSNYLYNEMRAAVPVKTGLLKSHIYQWYDTKASDEFTKLYKIGVHVNPKTGAPHWWLIEHGHWRYNKALPGGKFAKSKSNPKARGPQAHDLESGKLDEPRWVEAKPYIRPTADKMPQAVEAMKKRLVERIKEVMSGKP